MSSCYGKILNIEIEVNHLAQEVLISNQLTRMIAAEKQLQNARCCNSKVMEHQKHPNRKTLAKSLFLLF